MFRAVISFLTRVIAFHSVRGDEIRFSTQIRPLLSDKCFQCHGPDAEKRAAGRQVEHQHAV